MMGLVVLAWRNLTKYWARYQILLLIVVLGASLSLIVAGITASFGEVLKAKATLYFGGDLAVLGYTADGSHRVVDDAGLLEAMKTSGIPNQSLSRRTVSYDSESILFFSGNAMKQRRLIGVDPMVEATTLSALDFDEGSAARMVSGPGVVISRGTANKLKIRVGDECTLLLDSIKGSKNTVHLLVSGIFHDTSFFGYSAYLSIDTLDAALDLPKGTSTEMGMTLSPRADGKQAASVLKTALARHFTVLPLGSKTELDALNDHPQGTTDRYAVLPLSARLSQIQSILDALLFVSVLMGILFLAIVVLGVGSTFRAVLVERTREIGTMRALGMGRVRLTTLVALEAVFLAGIGGLAGTLLGSVGLGFVSWYDWGSEPLSAMFLRRGHLVWVLPWDRMAEMLVALAAAGLFGVLGPARRAAHWKPVDALRYHS